MDTVELQIDRMLESLKAAHGSEWVLEYLQNLLKEQQGVNQCPEETVMNTNTPIAHAASANLSTP